MFLTKNWPPHTSPTCPDMPTNWLSEIKKRKAITWSVGIKKITHIIAAPWPWPSYSFFLHRVIQTRHRRSLSEQLFAHRHKVRSGSGLSQTDHLLPHFASAPCLFRIQWMPVNRHVERKKNWRLRMLSRMIRKPWLSRRWQTCFMEPSISANSTINIWCSNLSNTKYQPAEGI